MKRLALPLLCILACASGLSRPAAADPAPIITHVIWTNTDGRLSVWNYTDSGSFTSLNYGPYAGWTAKAIADGPDGRQRVLWTNADGRVSLWSLDNTTGAFTQTTFGPYAGWSASALSVSPGPGVTGDTGATGPAGGDLFGFYPNPTIAPNAVDHTKLASDPGSLGQVSGGLLSTNDNWHVNVQNDLIVFGTVIAVQGNGGGAGNNNHEGRAIVDDGANGLAINYGNDFGQVVINGGTTVHGTLGTDGNISVGGSDFSLHGRGGGVGNNGGAGRALVDNGAAGLVLNYAGDFGNLDIQSDTYIHGNINNFGNLYSTGDITTAGTMYAKSLQLTGGSDLAEPYTIAASDNTQPLPGMVVAIDPQQTGQMRVCTRAYDTTVGGIISGAGGVHPGITLRQKGTVADGTQPIACTGRVWCWCDADANGPIAPGDLLTTSAVPGHAMRVRNYDKAQGAILGKAMSPLSTGKGLVLVLVTLQ